MKNKIFEYFKKSTNERPWYINIVVMIIVVLGSLVVPTLLSYSFFKFTSKYVASLLGDLIYIILIILVYYKDLKSEFKNYKKDFKNNINISVRYYIIGLMFMAFFNLILIKILGGTISTNETEVRTLLKSSTLFMMINISIIAPIQEELIYRKSLQTVFKNKWVYALISGILFGGAHILINIFGGTFVVNDLLYILPYGSIGFAFALMDYKTKSTFSSMVVHSIHNTINAIIILSVL